MPRVSSRCTRTSTPLFPVHSSRGLLPARAIQSLGEIKLLRRLNAADPSDAHHILRLYDCFYFKEHLFIVTELLRDNLYELYKYINRSDWVPYFTLPRIRAIAYQCLTALAFIHVAL